MIFLYFRLEELLIMGLRSKDGIQNEVREWSI